MSSRSFLAVHHRETHYTTIEKQPIGSARVGQKSFESQNGNTILKHCHYYFVSIPLWPLARDAPPKLRMLRRPKHESAHKYA